MAKTTLVKLLIDVYPYGTMGDVVALTGKDLADIKEKAEKRDVKVAYEEVKADKKAEAKTEDKK